METPFVRLDTGSIKNHTILLDIDGTLACDGQTKMAKAVLETVELLKKDNVIYLCSNRPNHKRNQTVAAKLGVTYLYTNRRKPSKKIIDLIPKKHQKNYLVIGDKWLTDGRFARRIGGEFVKVERLTCKNDGLLAQWMYFVDRLAKPFFS